MNVLTLTHCANATTRSVPSDLRSALGFGVNQVTGDSDSGIGPGNLPAAISQECVRLAVDAITGYLAGVLVTRGERDDYV